jgi:hypothetical protein
MNWIDEYQYGKQTDLNVQMVRRNKRLELRGGKSSFTMVGCRIKEYKLLDGMDTSSGEDVTKVEITFTVDDVSYGRKQRG